MSSLDSSITLGSSSGSLGDSLRLTALVEPLRHRYPHLRLRYATRCFDPYVFRGNPDVEGPHFFAREVFDERALAEALGPELAAEAARSTPRLFVDDAERRSARELLSDAELPVNDGKPVCVLHPWGGGHRKIAPVEFWDALVARHADEWRFWQIGLENDSAVVGCEYYFLLGPWRRNVRRLFALVSEAQAFCGLDSGPMHVARAFGLPSLVLLADRDARKNRDLLYEESHLHVRLEGVDPRDPTRVVPPDTVMLDIDWFFANP